MSPLNTSPVANIYFISLKSQACYIASPFSHSHDTLAASRRCRTSQPGIWNLTLSVRRLEAADGTFSATIATWTSLLPAAAAAGSQDCYPRVLYGAAHLTSTSTTSNSTSYIAVHGGLTSNDASLWAEASSSICVLELAASGTTRWLRQPPWAEGLAPGVGGLDVETLLATCRLDFTGSVAISTNPAVSLNSSSQPAEANFSPVLVIGGSTSVADDAVALPPHQSIWLLDAASCADPDAADSGSTVQRDLKAQIWLSLLPNGGALRKLCPPLASRVSPGPRFR
ncbi:hypothetical protein VOLCADRAFT_87248 [Volvox carteri f. nagariensis]|uniref:Uncharacterized protein n=1 Tax=Volvox carteri f. nagariensis TaxID=3068 RepID=D8TKJ2_VOLCA|nr:uncharacterized protein VOLCADRAFT_87248 [Volvox carteri f. nagariensis]EFJ52256.1 hypothetical protein VOLCADRAFT_87248 [Volvox carteri f. nagariensis]|eukprot:XP_002947030.1 hypothetical protein VOLCADRAFT_87248 [Volvox carteri f. nagariensis]